MTAHDFIWSKLKAANLTFEAEQYITDMYYEKVRICNDGFPDSRSPMTNEYLVRLKIADYRQLYRSYQHKEYMNSFRKDCKTLRDSYIQGYDKALDDVADSIYSANQTAKPILITQHIANLRRILKRD